eukprot:CAMPEP_0174324818 /NCGR_PEP_ID=MMETSP0810-20121108/12757_1 /TAXON_ID=73025 ORGANISM="Eutreptiella gymnastica-like, Strain CCMP1594" /NCGR_SAMPLE_ID=MMETSP0810 /ASSEMBLY_ACC=CAM_ASM_000659 /LENGTH=54 /DNA_ID=CAMNT_0015437765 /DNA_START=1443 /DNA_END=1607 /DNA_ORIENTATION=+
MMRVRGGGAALRLQRGRHAAGFVMTAGVAGWLQASGAIGFVMVARLKSVRIFNE